MAKQRQRWALGDIFFVPIRDGRFVPGQVVGREAQVLNSATVAFFDEPIRGDDQAAVACPPPLDTLFAVLFVTRDLLDSGRWKVVGHTTIEVPSRLMPYEHLRGRGFIGAKVIGSGIVNDFLDAFYGLSPWDDWKDPAYLDGLLLSSDKKPLDRLIFKRSDPAG